MVTTTKTPGVHIKLPATMKTYISKRCKELNKANQDSEQKWDRSKYIRWLIRRDMRGDLQPQGTHPMGQPVPQDGHLEATGDYSEFLNITRR
jgi:hypothetical protein